MKSIKEQQPRASRWKIRERLPILFQNGLKTEEKPNWSSCQTESVSNVQQQRKNGDLETSSCGENRSVWRTNLVEQAEMEQLGNNGRRVSPTVMLPLVLNPKKIMYLCENGDSLNARRE